MHPINREQELMLFKRRGKIIAQMMNVISTWMSLVRKHFHFSAIYKSDMQILDCKIINVKGFIGIPTTEQLMDWSSLPKRVWFDHHWKSNFDRSRTHSKSIVKIVIFFVGKEKKVFSFSFETFLAKETRFQCLAKNTSELRLLSFLYCIQKVLMEFGSTEISSFKPRMLLFLLKKIWIYCVMKKVFEVRKQLSICIGFLLKECWEKGFIHLSFSVISKFKFNQDLG